MRLFDAIVQPSRGSYADVRHAIEFWDPLLGRRVAGEFISYDALGCLACANQQSAKEALRSGWIPALLDEDIQHLTMLVYRTPEIDPSAVHPQEHLIEVPRLAGSNFPAPQFLGEERAELYSPASHRFVGNLDASLGQ
jgi:hypothetical protein